MSTTVFRNSTAVDYHRPMGLGSIIRERRLAKGWTLEQLSEKTEGVVEPGTISALELRDSERSKYFPVLAKALGETMESLAGGTPITHPAESPATPSAEDQLVAAVVASFLLLDPLEQEVTAIRLKGAADEALARRKHAANAPSATADPPLAPKGERPVAA